MKVLELCQKGMRRKTLYIFIEEFLSYSTAGNKHNKPNGTQGDLQPSNSNKPKRQDSTVLNKKNELIMTLELSDLSLGLYEIELFQNL